MQISEHNIKNKPNLKITILTTSFPRFQDDSAGIFIYKFASHLAESNCLVNVVAPHDIEVRRQEFFKNLGIYYFKYFCPLKFQSFAYKGGMVNRIKKNWLRILQFPIFMICFLLKAFRVSKDSDIIHSYWSVAGLIAIITGAARKTPVVLNIWGSDIIFTKVPVISFFYKLFLNQADAIVCESQHFKKQLTDFGIPWDLISVVPNGIDLDQFKPSNNISLRNKLGLSQHHKIFLTIGSLIHRKGHIYLIEAVPHIIKNFNNVHFIIVGEGEFRKNLEERIHHLKISSYITLAGYQKPSSIAEWLNVADVFILTSLLEGNPNVILEAMACGIPVISTSVGGIEGMIQEGENGLLMPAKSSTSLAEQANKILQNDELKINLGQNARKTILNNYGDWKKQSQLLLNVYQKTKTNNKFA